MTARELHWLDDRDPRTIVRWSAAAAVVVGLYGALIAGHLVWHQPGEEIGDLTPVVTVDLAPIDSVVDANQRDIAPGPEDMVEQKPVPEAEKQPEEQPKTEEPPPPAATADIALLNPNRRRRWRRSARPLPARWRASKAARRALRRRGKPIWSGICNSTSDTPRARRQNTSRAWCCSASASIAAGAC